MTTEQFLRLQGWEISGTDAYFPKAGAARIHMRLRQAAPDGTARATADIGGGRSLAAVTGAYRAMAPFVTSIAVNRGDRADATLVAEGRLTHDGDRYGEFLKGAAPEMSALRNKLYYLMAEF